MDPKRVDEWAEQAAKALASGAPLRALAIADQLASLHPEDVLTRILRAHALLATDSVEDGFREAQVAALLDAENEDAQLVLALAAWRMRKIPLAQQAFERAVDLAGPASEVAAHFAWFLASEQRATRALRSAERVLGLSPRLATAWAALGLAQFRLQRGAVAEKSLRRALEIDPHCPEAQSAMIRVLKRRGEHRQAEMLREILNEAGKRYGLFVEGPQEIALEKDIPETSPDANLPPVETSPSEKHASWAWRVTTTMVGIALALVVVVLMLRHPGLGLISLVASLAILVIMSRASR